MKTRINIALISLLIALVCYFVIVTNRPPVVDTFADHSEISDYFIIDMRTDSTPNAIDTLYGCEPCNEIFERWAEVQNQFIVK